MSPSLNMSWHSDVDTSIYPLVDKAIGSVIAVTFIVAILGNVFALVYFWPEREKTDLHRMYIAIASVDVLTSLLTIPVMTSLFNNREPVLFASPILCGGWTITFGFLVRISMFLVALMSVTRTIAIVRPFKEVKLSSIFVMTTGYTALLLTLDGAFFASGWITGSYYPTKRSFCSYAPTNHAQASRAKVFLFFLFQIEIFLPPLVIFISFMISIISLMRKRSRLVALLGKVSRHDSITVISITAVFLFCNVPLFVWQLLNLFLFIKPSFEADIGTKLIKTYGHLLFMYVPYVLNAALNPVVYLLRMSGCKQKFLRWS